MSPFCRAKEKKSPAVKQPPTALVSEPLPMEGSSSAVDDAAGEGTSGAIKRSLGFVTKRVKRHRSLSSLVALSDSNLPSPSHSLFSQHSPQSSASSIHTPELHDIEPAKGGFQELKHFKIGENGVKTHPYNTKDAPYMQCYDDMALKNDWYTLSLLKKLMPKHSPTFHDYKHKPPARVLDLGCGQGYWVVEAANAWKAWNVKVTGLDLVDLTTNAWDLEKQVADNVTWVRHNFIQYRLPFPDNSFDLVRIANMSLAVPFDRWSFIFVEANRVLSSGGRLELIDDHMFFPYVSPPSIPSPMLSPSLKSSSTMSTPAPSPQLARSRPLTPSPLAQSRPLPPSSPVVQPRRLPQLPSPASPPVAKPSRPSKSPARPSTAPLPAPTSNSLTSSPRATSPALKSTHPSKSPARPLPFVPRSSSYTSSPPASSPAFKPPLPPKSPARPSNALPKSSPSRSPSPVLKSSRPPKSPARPSAASPPVLVPPPRASSSVAPASPPAPPRPLRKRPPTPMRPLPSPPRKEMQAQAQDTSSDDEWGNKPSPKALADPYDDWRHEMSNCNDLETIFSRMIWSKYGVHPRPAEVIGKMVEFAFGGAPKATSLNVCLPSRSFIDTQAREMKARKVPEFEARISWFVSVDWGKEKEEGKEKADRERKDKDKGQKDSVRVTDFPAAGISGKAAKMLGTSNLSPAGLPYQQSGLVLFPSTFLHMSPAEVEMHTCRNLHLLIGCSAALQEYMHEFKGKDGKPMVSSKDLEDALWDYQTFRRKRFNWPSDLPELRMFDPVSERDTQKDARSSFDSTRTMRTSIDSVRPERKGGPPARSQLLNPRQSSEGLTTVRSFRIFEAYKGGPPPPKRAF